MARRTVGSLLVTVFAVSGCYGQEIPVLVQLDSRWEPDEADAIMYGMRRLEEATGLRLFEFGEPFEDEDGEYTAFEDGDDGRHVIYKLLEANEDSEFIENRELSPAQRADSNYIAGWGMKTDVLLFWFHFRNQYSDIRDDYLVFLSNLATHETDHFLGPGHNNVGCDESLMVYSMCAPRGEYVEITDEDVDQLCVFYDCPGR